MSCELSIEQSVRLSLAMAAIKNSSIASTALDMDSLNLVASFVLSGVDSSHATDTQNTGLTNTPET